jgi:hypothetical protein
MRKSQVRSVDDLIRKLHKLIRCRMAPCGWRHYYKTEQARANSHQCRRHPRHNGHHRIGERHPHAPSRQLGNCCRLTPGSGAVRPPCDQQLREKKYHQGILCRRWPERASILRSEDGAISSERLWRERGLGCKVLTPFAEPDTLRPSREKLVARSHFIPSFPG